MNRDLVHSAKADFSLVPWGSTANKGPPRKETDPDWLQQIWFAGNHSDIGGSYLENESCRQSRRLLLRDRVSRLTTPI